MGIWSKGAVDTRIETMNGLLAFVLCLDRQCRYSEGFADLRLAPDVCPRCGHDVLAACPRCGMLLRNRWGVCTNCGVLLGWGSLALTPPLPRHA